MNAFIHSPFGGKGMSNEIRVHQIEQLLLNAHVENDADLIEEYFLAQSSLHQITDLAEKLIQATQDPNVHKVILQNLSECIVVKLQKEKGSLKGAIRKFVQKVTGMQSTDIARAEKLIHDQRK